MSIEWTEDLSVGLHAVDEQHKELFRRVDQLLTACREGHAPDRVAGIIAFLEDYTIEHFSTEENLMLHYGYPGYKIHKAQHEELTRQAQALKELFKRDGASFATAMEVCTTLVDWLVKHIRKTDMDMGAFLKTQP